jgi:hypothetical protein
MATWIISKWPFIIYQGQYEFRVLANLSSLKQCSRISSKYRTLESSSPPVGKFILKTQAIQDNGHYLCSFQPMGVKAVVAFVDYEALFSHPLHPRPHS